MNTRAKSAYNSLIEGGKVKWQYNFIWRSKAPPTAKFFAYLVIQDKILTKDVMRRRGLIFSLECACFRQCPIESTLHLLFLCPVAVSIWFHIVILLTRPIFKVGSTIEQIWDKSWEMVKKDGGMSKREWTTRFIGTAWHIWKSRNAIIFNQQRVDAKTVAFRSFQDMRLWLKHC